MSKFYKIVWYSKVTDYQSSGEPFADRDVLQSACNIANAMYPSICHEVVECDGDGNIIYLEEKASNE